MKMTEVIRNLHNDEEAQEIIERARHRDSRYGAGDAYDFALFVVDETRKVERRKRRHGLAAHTQLLKVPQVRKGAEVMGRNMRYTPREMRLIYWLLRGHVAYRREGWEDGPNESETRCDIGNVLNNLGFDPDGKHAAELLKNPPRCPHSAEDDEPLTAPVTARTKGE